MRNFLVKVHTKAGTLLTELNERELDELDDARETDISADWFEIVSELTV